MSFKIGVLKNFGLQLFKNRLQQKCCPVNIANFFRTPFLVEYFQWLLLVGIGSSVTLTFLTTTLKDIFPFSKDTVMAMIRKGKGGKVLTRLSEIPPGKNFITEYHQIKFNVIIQGIRKTPTRKISAHQTPPSKIPTRKIPTQKIPTWNIPTRVFYLTSLDGYF